MKIDGDANRKIEKNVSLMKPNLAYCSSKILHVKENTMESPGFNKKKILHKIKLIRKFYVQSRMFIS